MNYRTIFHLVSYILLVLAAGMAVSAGVGWWMGDTHDQILGVVYAAGINLAAGGLLNFFTRGSHETMRRDGFAIVTLGWLACAVFGALPYMLTGVIPGFISATFETMSGFTTTGASVISDCEAVPRGVMFWRCLTQWLGGMGVLVLCIAVLPFLKAGAMQIFRAEVSGPTKDRLTPHIMTTAKLLWGLYFGMTVANVLALWLAGMSFYESVCHAFGTISTSGFSTRTISVAAYDSVLIECIFIFFLFISGMNFTLHYYALRGQFGNYWQDREWRVYVIAWACGIGFATLDVHLLQDTSLAAALRGAAFSVTSIMTSGGFSTADFALWPAASKLLLVVMMICGACAGSTGGGIKLMRCNLVFRHISRELKKFIRPNAIYKIKYCDRVVEDDMISNISAFVVLYLIVFAFGSLLMCLFTPDTETAYSAVAACMGNVGPGLSAVGPLANYGWIHPAGKFILTGCMLLGRLELYTLLVILSPAYWRK